ncbi:hypothetical protein BH23VER1_BH23VER1_26970 [soil metagenome]
MRKALRLFGRSNGPVLEWLGSPIIYREATVEIAAWRTGVEAVADPKALAAHYLGMARRPWFRERQDEPVRLKGLLYALRAVCAARWIVDGRGVPPVAFRTMVDHLDLNDGDDTVFYEVGRFADLLRKNNPNLVEMLFADRSSVLFRDPLFDLFRPEAFLSKLCADTFARYAMEQVRKAQGLKKKIVNPQPVERLRPIDFCHVLEGQGSVALREWVGSRGMRVRRCGVVNVPHARDLYAIYYGGEKYRGIFQDDDSSEVRCSSVPVGAAPVAWMSFNRDAYRRHCREHAAYWNWVEKRNEARYATTVAHGKNYDSKNMMHTFRLLDMAEEIAGCATLTVRRRNREFLMRIRTGEFGYGELVAMAEERAARIAGLFAASDLPERPDTGEIERMVVALREQFYRGRAGG